MSLILPESPPASADTGEAVRCGVTPAEIDASCRLPLVWLFLSGALWLVIGSALALVASIKFHAPDFLADPGWLTYGRVRPASVNSMLYGFCLQTGLGVVLWMVARLGQTALVRPGLITVGAGCWNLGVTAGVLGILAGGSTGYENLEMPPYAASLLFLGCLMVGIGGVLTFHRRRERQLYVSQWFILAALFWFPWVYATANLLLAGTGARGMAQAVIAWWYSENLLAVWLGLVGLAAALYFVPKLVNRELHSRYLALLAFWILILFGSWGGIPASAPVPAWMPVASAVTRVLGVIAVIAVLLNVHRTVRGKCSTLRGHPSWWFIGFGTAAFAVAGLAKAATAFRAVSRVTQFTWFTPAWDLLNAYGYFTMVMFGAAYYIVPQLVGREFPPGKLVRVHFWTAGAGILCFVVPLAAGGIVQGLKLQQAVIPFADVTRGTLPFLRASTMGDLLMALGHLLFLANLALLAFRFYRARAVSAWAEATAEIPAAGVRV
ncbi:MAG TPA: cbb3-type cytochrome c oxidase subunit I [Candidatus Paceibacterota bacterium]|nr:cbb3-type cytochrome c oxidase subunit I [Verrucomicrobiota bacterium]HSA09242.1 cbb3-type cytochrome c oxidase subunit I [Candidatus Paceibacterota bacterium]